MSTDRTRSIPEATPDRLVPPAVRVGDLVFVSGQASVDDNGDIVPGTFAAQMDRSIENLRRVLADEGLSLADVVKVSAYIRDPADIAEYNQLYAQYFMPPRPARTTIVNCLPEPVAFEIEAVASAQRGDDSDER